MNSCYAVAHELLKSCSIQGYFRSTSQKFIVVGKTSSTQCNDFNRQVSDLPLPLLTTFQVFSNLEPNLSKFIN